MASDEIRSDINRIKQTIFPVSIRVLVDHFKLSTRERLLSTFSSQSHYQPLPAQALAAIVGEMLEKPHLVSLSTIRRKTDEIARRIGLREITVSETPQGDGSPYIEIDQAYCLVFEERGVEFERRQTLDLDELLYWIFDSATFSAACSFELKNRRSQEDPRRQLFSRQEELLGLASSEWGSRKSQEHVSILARHPFNDRAKL